MAKRSKCRDSTASLTFQDLLKLDHLDLRYNTLQPNGPAEPASCICLGLVTLGPPGSLTAWLHGRTESTTERHSDTTTQTVDRQSTCLMHRHCLPARPNLLVADHTLYLGSTTVMLFHVGLPPHPAVSDESVLAPPPPRGAARGWRRGRFPHSFYRGRSGLSDQQPCHGTVRHTQIAYPFPSQQVTSPSVEFCTIGWPQASIPCILPT